MNGTVGEMHAKKIEGIYDMALKMGAPVIGLIDCAGIRLQEATDALDAFGKIYRKMSDASGVIPQITAVYGNCGGGLAVLAGLSDFTFMEEKTGHLFVNSPNALAGNYAEKLDTSSAKFQAEAGVVDFTGDEETIANGIRQLVSILPANNETEAFADCEDDLNRVCADMAAEIADPALALSDISDDNLFVEVKAEFAKEMVTGFIQVDGSTIGAVANRTALFDENGETVYTVKGQLSFGHKLFIYDRYNEHLGTIKEEILTFLPRFSLYEKDQYIGKITKEFTLFKPSFILDYKDWQIEGDFLEWDYQIVDHSGNIIGLINKEIFNSKDP